MIAANRSFQIDPKRWLRLNTGPFADPRAAIFLDRDGVVIEERHYLSDPAGVRLIDGCVPFLRLARERGYALVMITNQSGIGRGYFGWPDYARVEDTMLELLSRAGIELDAVLANANLPGDSSNDWRKPQPGMLSTASERLNLSLTESVVVGDKASDMAAGRAAGVRCGVHVLTGHGARERDAAAAQSSDVFPVHVVCGLGSCRLPLT